MRSRILEWFESFVAEHRMGDPEDARRIALKREHCLRVMAEAEGIAAELDLPGPMVELAVLAGLLHDVGRFPQYAAYRTFRDEDSVNHGLLSAAVLARRRVLAGLDAAGRRTVRAAVALHNRRDLPRFAAVPGHDADAALLLRLVRDADKLDIARVMLAHFRRPGDKDEVVFLGLTDIPGAYSRDILAAVDAGGIGDYRMMRTVNDFVLLLLSWLNDLAFSRSRRLFFSRGHVRDLFAELPGTPEIAAFKDRFLGRFAADAAAGGM